ncbi:co-chaperone DjlA [Thalassotalea agariperforans]
MQIWGKVLGALFGFMLTKSPIGAIIGAIIGHRFDKSLGFNFDGLHQKTEQDRQGAFLYTSFSVMGHIAKAKGRVTEHEIQFASQYMTKLGLTGDLRQQAQDAFREGKMAGFPLKERLQKFKALCRGREDLIMMFLEIQIQLAFADGQLDQEERAVLHTIAQHLGFSTVELDRLLEMIIAGAQFHGGNANGSQQNRPTSASQLENAYKVLGIDKNSDEKTVKKAYRKLMSQHHPDKLVAKGLPKEMMEVAKQKTQDIQSAYEMICKQTK